MSHWWEASVWLKWLASPYFNLLRAEQLMKRREELEQELRDAKDPAERKQKAEELRQQMDDISEAMKVITGDPFPFVHQTKVKRT